MKCDHIIAFHIGHSYIAVSVVKEFGREMLYNDCGGTMLLNFCPLCGKGVRNIINKLSKINP